MEHLQFTDINYGELFDEFRNPNSGAVVLFSGEVRDNNKGRKFLTWNMKRMSPWLTR